MHVEQADARGRGQHRRRRGKTTEHVAAGPGLRVVAVFRRRRERRDSRRRRRAVVRCMGGGRTREPGQHDAKQRHSCDSPSRPFRPSCLPLHDYHHSVRRRPRQSRIPHPHPAAGNAAAPPLADCRGHGASLMSVRIRSGRERARREGSGGDAAVGHTSLGPAPSLVPVTAIPPGPSLLLDGRDHAAAVVRCTALSRTAFRLRPAGVRTTLTRRTGHVRSGSKRLLVCGPLSKSHALFARGPAARQGASGEARAQRVRALVNSWQGHGRSE